MQLLHFRGVAAVVVLTAGGDMALLTRNATLMHGRRAAGATAIGINIVAVSATVVEAIAVCRAVRLRKGKLP